MNISNSGVFQAKTLEVDESLFDKSLRIIDSGGPSSGMVNNPASFDNKKTLFPEQDLPSVAVVPDPGMCVKTKNIAGDKVFLNFCKIHAIPPAKPISENALQDIIANENYNIDYSIPMSLMAPRSEKDKSGKDCYACDVAVNSVWYDQTMVDSLTFTTFLVTVAMEGLCNKYGDTCNLDRQNWSILRNKRYMGKVQRHKIEQRASATKIQEVVNSEMEKKDIGKTDLITPLSTTISKPLISQVKEQPELLLIKQPHDASNPHEMIATLKLPKILSKDELLLELGPDRLLLQSDMYLLDIFLPFNIYPEQSTAEFHRDERHLKVQMKVSKNLL